VVGSIDRTKLKELSSERRVRNHDSRLTFHRGCMPQASSLAVLTVATGISPFDSDALLKRSANTDLDDHKSQDFSASVSAGLIGGR
jgi:hypothetical protein